MGTDRTYEDYLEVGMQHHCLVKRGAFVSKEGLQVAIRSYSKVIEILKERIACAGTADEEYLKQHYETTIADSVDEMKDLIHYKNKYYR